MHLFTILLLCKCGLQTCAASRSWLDPKLWKLGVLKVICFVSLSLYLQGAVLNVVERFHTLLKLGYFCRLHDAGKFLFAHFSVVSETPKPLISDLVEADGISPIAKAVSEFKFFCGRHSVDSESKARDGHSSGFTKRTCILSVFCSHSLNLHPPLAGKLQI